MSIDKIIEEDNISFEAFEKALEEGVFDNSGIKKLIDGTVDNIKLLKAEDRTDEERNILLDTAEKQILEVYHNAIVSFPTNIKEHMVKILENKLA